MAHATTRAFADERRSAIMEMLEHNASVQVAEIAQTFGVSSVTARADLDALAESGKLRRTHGGAVSLQKRLTVSTQDRRINVNVAAKQAIAQSAIELVNDGDTLLVDSGTTALEFVRLLDQRDGITVITADITIADYIDESMPSVDVVMLGGHCAKAIAICTAHLPCRRSKWSTPILPSCALAHLFPAAALRPTFRRWPRPKRLWSVLLVKVSPSWTPVRSTDVACTALPS